MADEKIMIFCTCAEKGKEQYLRNMNYWYKQFKHFSWFDRIVFYCFVDGILNQSDIEKYEQLKHIIFVSNYPILTNENRFGGWFRSFNEGLEKSLSYKYAAHVEQDVFILNFDKFEQTLFRPQQNIYCGFAAPHGFADTALIFLNSKDKTLKMIKENKIWMEGEYKDIYIPEYFFNKVASPQIQMRGFRRESIDQSMNDLKNEDYISQVFSVEDWPNYFNENGFFNIK